MGIISFLSGPRDYNEFLSNGASRVAVSGELKFIFIVELEGRGVHFVALKQTLIVLVEVTSTNKEETTLGRDHCLEIMWEVRRADGGSFW